MLAIFLDIESSGLDPCRHHVLDIGLKVVDLSQEGMVRGNYQSIVKQPLLNWEKRDPLSMKINGYTWEQVCQGKEQATVGKEIQELLTSIPIERGKSMFICQNPGFDRAFFAQLVDVYLQEKLNWPYHWLDLASMFWLKECQQKMAKREKIPQEMSLSKNEIARVYGLPPEVEPHRAMNGVEHLIQCYQAVLGVNFVLSNP